MQVITPDNYKDVDLEGMALSPRFGSLIFSMAAQRLKRLQGIFIELDTLDYKNQLTESKAREVDNFKIELIKKINWLNQFDIGGVTNAKDQHDNFEGEIESFYNSIQENFVMRYLPYLRQEVALKNKDERKLQEELQAANKVRVKAEGMLEQLEKKLILIDEEKKKVESGQGQLGAKRLAKYFETEYEDYEKKSKSWLKMRDVFYWVIFILLLLMIIWHFYFGWERLSWQEGAAKLVIVSVLWYAVAFATRNYYIYSNLTAVNRHRAAVARTLEDFLGTGSERQNEMLKNATESMFKSAPIGFVAKTEKENSSPIFEIINKIVGPGSGI